MKCPCESCLKLAICKHKEYFQIVDNCNDIGVYLDEEHNKHNERAKEFERTLRPSSWKLVKHSGYIRFSSIGLRIIKKEL